MAGLEFGGGFSFSHCSTYATNACADAKNTIKRDAPPLMTSKRGLNSHCRLIVFSGIAQPSFAVFVGFEDPEAQNFKDMDMWHGESSLSDEQAGQAIKYLLWRTFLIKYRNKYSIAFHLRWIQNESCPKLSLVLITRQAERFQLELELRDHYILGVENRETYLYWTWKCIALYHYIRKCWRWIFRKNLLPVPVLEIHLK